MTTWFLCHQSGNLGTSDKQRTCLLYLPSDAGHVNRALVVRGKSHHIGRDSVASRQPRRTLKARLLSKRENIKERKGLTAESSLEPASKHPHVLFTIASLDKVAILWTATGQRDEKMVWLASRRYPGHRRLRRRAVFTLGNARSFS